jgi:PAS domain S-box-containing protein
VFPWAVGTIIEREFKRAVQEQVPVEFERYFDAYSKWLSVKAYPQKDGGLSVYFKDITAQKYAENELRAQTERLRVTLASIGDAVIVTDTAARVVSLNAVAQSLTGWDSDQALNHSLDEVFNIVNEHSRERAENPARRALREGMVVGLANHTVLVSKKGVEHPIDDSAAPIKDEKGNVLGVVLVFRDVTERKKAEDERTELLRREKAARGEAERANRMKDEFLAVVSHELRTPLTPILGWTRILKTNGASPENMAKGLEVIERNVNAQTRVIDDLLDISRIISGKLMLNITETELESIVEAAIDTVQPAATGKQISINTHFDGGRPHVVKADANRLQQVIWNLVGNAIKFTPQNGKIDVTLRNLDSMVEIEVSDNGEGIDPNILPLLFNRFMQADSTIRRAHGGLGLGLAIVRHLVEAHGGTVSAFSEGRGRGATFKVRLPLAAAVGQADGANARPKKESNGRVLENLNLLLVEDDADSLEMIAMMLEEAGARVMRADSAAEALQRFTERIPDAIVSDIGLPVEDGYAFIRKIRQRGKESGGGVPAIALTAFAKTEDRIHALSSGFQLHIAKPVEPAELVAAVATISGRTV